MNILVLNCGSSSLKYRLLDAQSEIELLSGEAQRIGPPTAEPSRVVHRQHGNEIVRVVPMHNHAEAFEVVMALVAETSSAAIDAIAHRVAHGGSAYRQPALIDGPFSANLDELSELAPLHNPPAIELIRACQRLYSQLPQVAVFDTTYHVTIPEYAYTYALPRELREEHGIRKFGFHGTSHQFVMAEAASFLGLDPSRFNAVSCHLGSGGASLCAIKNGRSLDNTMGYSPLQGLIMSTRCGDLDPAIAMQLLARANGDWEKVDRLLNRGSGVLGLSGVSGDIRDVIRQEHPGDGPAPLAATARIYVWRLKKYLGAYLSIVKDAQAVIFTDTIGEEVPEVREALCAGMGAFGIRIDRKANRTVTSFPADVASRDSEVRLLVVRTNEERAITRAAYRRLRGNPTLEATA